MENEKELRVLEAAKTVFLRHGFRRVTMQDIADEAGISRPALYLIFPNKEEIFKAGFVWMSGESMKAIREGLAHQGGVEERLNFAFDVWSVRPFELMRSSPDAKDLIDCTHGFARETGLRISAEFEALLVEILAPVTCGRRSTVLPAEQIAHLLAASIHGFKESCATVEELREMVAGMIRLTLAGLESGA